MRRTLALALLAAACGDSPTAPTAPAPVTGIYRLARVNGVATPAPIPGGLDGNPARATEGTVTLDGAGRWDARVAFAIEVSGAAVPVSRTFQGSYTVSRDTVRLRDGVDGELIVAVVRGARLSAVVDGATFDFDR